MNKDNTDIIEFAELVGKTKKIPRTGWVRKGINKVESVADHMYRSAVLCMVLGDLKGLDANKMIRMALLDDLAEALTGDLTPEDQAKIGNKAVMDDDEQAIRQIFAKLPKKLQEDYFNLWKESREHLTPESKLARELEKLEMVIQALEYQKDGFDAQKLEEFWTYVNQRVSDPDVVEIFRFLNQERHRSA